MRDNILPITTAILAFVAVGMCGWLIGYSMLKVTG